MTTRKLRVLPVPTGDRILELLTPLRAALAGSGPALLPVPEDDTRSTPRIPGPDSELADGEDDSDDPTALVVATSGSTGTPKGVLLSASALAASADATRQRLSSLQLAGQDLNPTSRPADADQWLLALPATHVAGLQVLLRAVRSSAGLTVLDTGAAFTADRFCATVGRIPAGPRFTSLVPTQLVRVLADPQAAAALATFDAVLVGGAAAPAALLRRAAEAGVTVVTTYGMTETCGGCLYDGLPLGGVTVSLEADLPPRDRDLASDADRPTSQRGGLGVNGAGATLGRVLISGSVVARGYHGLPADPAFQRRDGRRIFRTQDVGTRDGDRVRIIGRIDDVLVTGGIKVDPAAVESAVAAVAGVREVLVTAVPDPEWGQLVVAVVVPDKPAPPDLQAIRTAVTRVHGAPAAPRHLLLVDELPYRGIGKPDRRVVRGLAIRALTEPSGGPRRAGGTSTDLRSAATSARSTGLSTGLSTGQTTGQTTEPQ